MADPFLKLGEWMLSFHQPRLNCRWIDRGWQCFDWRVVMIAIRGGAQDKSTTREFAEVRREALRQSSAMQQKSKLDSSRTNETWPTIDNIQHSSNPGRLSTAIYNLFLLTSGRQILVSSEQANLPSSEERCVCIAVGQACQRLHPSQLIRSACKCRSIGFAFLILLFFSLFFCSGHRSVNTISQDRLFGERSNLAVW